MQPVNTQFSCIILAGGEGKRVGGKDKGLIPYKGKPMIEHVIEIANTQTDEIVISANRNIDIYKNYSRQVIPDQESICRGPLAGIAASLPYCSNDWVLVLPCDMLNIPKNIAQQLFSKIRNDNLSIVKNFERFQLVFLLNKTQLPSIEHALNINDLRLMHWIKSQNPSILNFSSNLYFQNFNDTSAFE
ncbi:Molybdopterin-guanine dinucleotide biosynthesis protein MobA [hydrothermal vent metagenome]|uniref:Molybdopterin-guanine dinucleotide biosynthesis protein MobA n=1 Tax=hydrothermal vent metagenome TaxID=652676 RepID=A0A3B0WFS9_9ZZZZ